MSPYEHPEVAEQQALHEQLGKDLRREAKVLIAECPILWEWLRKVTTPRMMAPSSDFNFMRLPTLTTGEMMAWRAGQYSVIEFIERKAGEPR